MVCAALLGSLKFSLWLTPDPASKFGQIMRELIAEQSERNGARPFASHVTLCPSFECNQREAVDKARRVAAALGGAVPAERSGEISLSTTKPFRVRRPCRDALQTVSPHTHCPTTHTGPQVSG